MSAPVAGSVAEALESAAAALSAAGAGTPRLDAELLLGAATGRSRAQLASAPEAGIEPGAGRALGEMVRRRIRREPVAYILGRKGFRRIELAVDPRALIPRPETELLVETAVELRPRRILDVGTGSGAVALALADELPAAEIVATDVSLEALALARANALALGFGERVRFLAAESGGSGAPAPDVAFDLVVANLPYVAEHEWDGLAPEIREFEPRAALVSGPTGLEAIEGLLAAVATGGLRTAAIALEVGAGQANVVSELVLRAGYERVEVRQDLAGIDRVVIGR